MLELLGLKPCRTQFDADMALLTGSLRQVRLTEDGRIKVTKPYLPAKAFFEAEARIKEELGYIDVSPRKPLAKPEFVPDYVI